jgi:hypothetical protein
MQTYHHRQTDTKTDYSTRMIGVQQVPTGLQVEEAVAIMIIDKIPEKMRVGVVQRRLLLLQSEANTNRKRRQTRTHTGATTHRDTVSTLGLSLLNLER